MDTYWLALMLFFVRLGALWIGAKPPVLHLLYIFPSFFLSLIPQITGCYVMVPKMGDPQTWGLQRTQFGGYMASLPIEHSRIRWMAFVTQAGVGDNRNTSALWLLFHCFSQEPTQIPFRFFKGMFHPREGGCPGTCLAKMGRNNDPPPGDF